ncbi:MaoC family dehydratase N-terminal domain-containing protein [Chloroflexota bacterium]
MNKEGVIERSALGKTILELSEAKALIGKEVETRDEEAYLAECPVEASEIRRYALSNEDCNPLWIDNEHAKKTRWGGIIAPPTFMHTCGGGGGVLGSLRIVGTDAFPAGSMYCGSEFEFLRPIRPGDKIRAKEVIYDFVEKTGGAFAGRVIFATSETTYTNQNDEIVGILRGSVAKYSTADAHKKSTYTTDELPKLSMNPPSESKLETKARGTNPLYYEDVPLGAEATPLVRELTIPKIVTTSHSGRVGIIPPFNQRGPGCWWHYAPGASWEVRGLPAPMDTGPVRCAQPSQLMTDWIGDDGWLRKLSVQIRRPIYAGDTTTWKGKVTNKYVKDNQHFVECEIWGENQRGQISTKGNATIILQSRS